MSANMRKLQRLIDNAAKHNRAAHQATEMLCEECRRLYGVEPGDIDADDIIDAVLGGCGTSSGMTAEEFDRIMRNGARP